MNKRKLIATTAILLVIAVAIGLLVMRLRKRPVAQLENAKDIYINTADATGDLRNYVLDVTQTHQITANEKTYTESASFLLSCEGFGADNMKVSKEETLSIGKHDTQFTEIYSDGTLYTAVNDSYFSSKIALEDYTQKIMPVVLLDYNLYKSFSGVDSGEEYVIYLTEPTEPEQWALPKGTTFQSASGTAYINYSGKLDKSIYILEYTKADVLHRMTVVAQLTKEAPAVTVPENTEQYTAIQYADGPKMLERASGFLTVIDNIYAVCKESTYFEAFGDKRTKTVEVQMKKDLDLTANVETKTLLSNESRVGQDTLYQQTEQFKNGIYALEMTDIPKTSNLEITEEEMHTYCLNLMVSTIMLPKDFQQCSTEEKDGIIRITYTANKDFGRQISQAACDTLYQEPDLLTKLTQTSVIDKMFGYLELDANSGLPVASGIYYSSTYTAEGLPYQFRFQADQTYQLKN